MILFLSIALMACQDDKDNDESSTDFDQTAFLQQEAELINQSYDDFAVKSRTLTNSVDSFIANPQSASLTTLKNNFKSAYSSWQKVNFYDFGPAMELAVKSNLNIYPVDTLQIENNIQSGTYDLDALSNKTAKGFPAIDYLINRYQESKTISDFSSSNRSSYLKDLTLEIDNYAAQLDQAWDNYTNEFIAASGTDVGSSTGQLINALNQHFERFFRDGKIGIPLGVRSSGIARPDYCEALFGAYSLELVAENLEAMRNCYLGGNGIGLDDYLQASDAAELDQNIQAQLNLISSKLSAVPPPLKTAVINHQQPTQELYNEIQKLIVLWKVDMPSRIGVLISYQDNDGD